MMKRTAHICTTAKQCCKPSAHICAVNLQPCNPLRTCAQSIYSRVMPSAPVRGHFAALQRHPAPVRGEIAEKQ
jgi:hypothetical protein